MFYTPYNLVCVAKPILLADIIDGACNLATVNQAERLGFPSTQRSREHVNTNKETSGIKKKHMNFYRSTRTTMIYLSCKGRIITYLDCMSLDFVFPFYYVTASLLKLKIDIWLVGSLIEIVLWLILIEELTSTQRIFNEHIEETNLEDLVCSRSLKFAVLVWSHFRTMEHLNVFKFWLWSQSQCPLIWFPLVKNHIKNRFKNYFKRLWKVPVWRHIMLADSVSKLWVIVYNPSIFFPSLWALAT